MAFSFSDCETEPFPSRSIDGKIENDIAQMPEEVPEVKVTADDISGLWLLDSRNNE